MPQFIVRRIAATPDGSSLSGGLTMVSAANQQEAEKLGAELLGGRVTAERYVDPNIEALKRGQL